MKGKIIFFNGSSSSGKTTLAYALQENVNEIYYRLSADDFINMVNFKKMHDNLPLILGETLIAMYHTIKLFSDRGLNVIVDHVLLETLEDKYTTPGCVKLLHNNPVMFVRVDCDLPELERRERERGDRDIGQAKWQIEHMHSHDIYDLRINTFKQSTDECLYEIIALLDKPHKWNAFNDLYKHLKL